MICRVHTERLKTMATNMASLSTNSHIRTCDGKRLRQPISLWKPLWNRLTISVGVYNKLTSDLLASVPFPSSSGVGSQYTNNGSVRNRGLELEADATLYRSKDWNTDSAPNATYMRQRSFRSHSTATKTIVPVRNTGLRS